MLLAFDKFIIAVEIEPAGVVGIVINLGNERFDTNLWCTVKENSFLFGQCNGSVPPIQILNPVFIEAKWVPKTLDCMFRFQCESYVPQRSTLSMPWLLGICSVPMNAAPTSFRVAACRSTSFIRSQCHNSGMI
jgi:hypothetical protein